MGGPPTHALPGARSNFCAASFHVVCHSQMDREYKSVCGSKEGIEKRAIGLYGDVRELRILSFLHELRANLSELVEHPRVGLLASVELALGGLG